MREDEAMQISYDEAKFTEMLLYVAHRLQTDQAGGRRS